MIKLKDLLPESHQEKSEENLYRAAGKNAPERIKAIIEEFRKLPPEERAKTPLLYWMLGEGTPNYKMSKGDSHYVDVSKIKGQMCQNCKFLYKRMDGEKFICSQVNENDSPSEGEIKLAGWCQRWKTMENVGE